MEAKGSAVMQSVRFVFTEKGWRLKNSLGPETGTLGQIKDFRFYQVKANGLDKMPSTCHETVTVQFSYMCYETMLFTLTSDPALAFSLKFFIHTITTYQSFSLQGLLPSEISSHFYFYFFLNYRFSLALHTVQLIFQGYDVLGRTSPVFERMSNAF